MATAQSDAIPTQQQRSHLHTPQNQQTAPLKSPSANHPPRHKSSGKIPLRMAALPSHNYYQNFDSHKSELPAHTHSIRVDPKLEPTGVWEISGDYPHHTSTVRPAAYQTYRVKFPDVCVCQYKNPSAYNSSGCRKMPRFLPDLPQNSACDIP